MAHRSSRWSARDTLILLAFVTVAIGIPLLITVYGQSGAERTRTIVFYGVFGLFVFLTVRFKVDFNEDLASTRARTARTSMMGGTADEVTPGSISNFFRWHFLDAVPLLKVNETLGWRPPLTYDSFSVGCMLLLFKAVVILPVIGAFTWYGTRHTAANERRVEVATVG
jgi:hypothetical protein